MNFWVPCERKVLNSWHYLKLEKILTHVYKTKLTRLLQLLTSSDSSLLPLPQLIVLVIQNISRKSLLSSCLKISSPEKDSLSFGVQFLQFIPTERIELIWECVNLK
ncbi:UNVERIFIED_CONTAM: hypothetical protein RMT77_007730 [Armadillidium vulgare]